MPLRRVNLLFILVFFCVLVSSGLAWATEYTVDPSWMTNFNGTGYSPVLINNILDNNPLTRGKEGSGIEDIVLQGGDTLTLSAGTYQLGLGLGNFEVRVSGTQAQPITIKGGGWDDTVLRGASPNSGRVWNVYASNIVLKDFRTENAFAGLIVNRSFSYENITFQQLKTMSHEQHYIWEEQNDVVPKVSPDIRFQNAYVIGGNAGFVFSPFDGATLNTKYAGVSNATLRNITGLGMQIPVVWDGMGSCTVLGNNDLENIVIQCDGQCANFISSTIPCFNTPSGFDEWNIGSATLAALNVQPSDPSRPPNIEADPMLDASGRPTFGSPAIGTQYPRGYSGAIPPLTLGFDGSPNPSFVRGDVNNDMAANAADIQGFIDIHLAPNLADQDPAYQRMLFASDCNGNNVIDGADIDCLADLLAGGQ